MKIDRLSREFVRLNVQVNGEPATENWTFLILPSGTRPDLPEDIEDTPEELGGFKGVMVGPGSDHELDPGRSLVWVRVVSNPEAPVFVAGTIDIE